MKKILFVFFIIYMCVLSFASHAIEPAYVGPLGNAEEPALRPYKWFWRGICAFGFQVKDKFIEGNMNTPLIGTIETTRGVRNGSTEFLYSFWKGILYSCPPQNPKHYQEKTALTQRVESDKVWGNVTDFICSGPAFPVLVAHDHICLESDSKVMERRKQAEIIHQARKDARKAREPKMSDVERAQFKYLGKRAYYGRTATKKYPKNLLKLAD